MLYKDYSSNFVFVADSENEAEPYYVGNSPAKKIGNNVYFRWEDGLFFKRNLSTSEETPIDFLNDMKLSMDTAVGFMDDFIAIEKISNTTPSVELFDFYGYDGAKKESDYQKQTDEYIYNLIETNLKDIEQTKKKYFDAKVNGESFKIINPDLNGKLTLSSIEKLYLTLRDQQLIGPLISSNFEKCFQLVKDSGAEDPINAFHNIIAVLSECGTTRKYSVFEESYISSLLTKLRETVEKTQFAQIISDYNVLKTALLKLID